MTRGVLPLRQPAREIIAGQFQSADAIRLRANAECGVPQPPTGSEPAREKSALRAIRIGTNPVTARDTPHTLILTPRSTGRSAEIQHAAGHPARNASNRAARNDSSRRLIPEAASIRAAWSSKLGTRETPHAWRRILVLRPRRRPY
jgi:hypothetical protein